MHLNPYGYVPSSELGDIIWDTFRNRQDVLGVRTWGYSNVGGGSFDQEVIVKTTLPDGQLGYSRFKVSVERIEDIYEDGCRYDGTRYEE